MRDKIALITGGTRGIGLAVARELSSRGAKVILNYFRSRNAAEAAAKETGGFLARGNVGRPEHVDRIFETLKSEFGRVDIVVSNAAAGPLRRVEELTLEDWQNAMDINARALLLLAKRASELMPEGGRIVSLTSVGPRRYIRNYGAMAAAKAALEALTRYLAVELAPRKITVNAVCAGIVDTDSLKSFPNYDEMIRAAKERTPLGRAGRPEDIAPVVAFLCSEQAAWITGQVIVADGGYELL